MASSAETAPRGSPSGSGPPSTSPRGPRAPKRPPRFGPGARSVWWSGALACRRQCVRPRPAGQAHSSAGAPSARGSHPSAFQGGRKTAVFGVEAPLEKEQLRGALQKLLAEWFAGIEQRPFAPHHPQRHPSQPQTPAYPGRAPGQYQRLAYYCLYKPLVRRWSRKRAIQVPNVDNKVSKVNFESGHVASCPRPKSVPSA